jgi:hypothetical protein
MVTPEVITLLRPEFRPKNMAGGFGGDYAGALPYWRDAFARLCSRAERTVPSQFASVLKGDVENLLKFVRELCEPDYLLRGHPQNQTGKQDRLGLERYISALAAAKTRAAIKSK